ncbi:MAG: bifunctional pyr operon transcriptional regulator/uracil phosphoribosyltransferase PyrR [Bacteroidota bacterium]
MSERLILAEEQLNITLRRLSQQLIETYSNIEDTVILALQPRGTYLAQHIVKILREEFDIKIPLGLLDTTFHRDDFRRRESPKKASFTDIPFQIEGKSVILIDDVLYTGRSVRAALDAMITFGRPKKVDLLVLIDRNYSRHLPIEAKFVGKKVNTGNNQTVVVQWIEIGDASNSVKLVDE